MISSAFSFDTLSLTALGTDSIKSLASFNPNDVKVRTTFMTVILLEVGTSCITTSNSVCSSITGSSTFVLIVLDANCAGELIEFVSTSKVSSLLLIVITCFINTY